MEQQLKTFTIKQKAEEIKRMFDETVVQTKKILVEEGKLHPIAFLLCHDKVSGEFVKVLIPMIMRSNNEKVAMIDVLKLVIKELEKSNNFTVLALLTVMDCYASNMKADGRPLNKVREEYEQRGIPVSEDPERKEILMFNLEEEYKKTFLSYEYMKTEAVGGEESVIVIKDEPLFNYTTPYDTNISQGTFSYIFTKSAGSTN